MGEDSPEGFPAHLRRRVALGLDALRKEGVDEEALHDRRVASRRLRAAAALVAPWAEDGQVERAEARLKTLTRSLGRVREWDVALGLLRRLCEAAPTDLERAGWEHLETLAERARRRAGRRMDEEDPGKALRAATKAMETLLEGVPHRFDAGGLPGVAWAYLQPRLRDGFGALPALALQENPEVMHAARTSLKELRYGLEHLAPAFHGDLEAWLGRIRVLQDALGRHHDWVVLEEWLEAVRLELAVARRSALAGGLAQGRASLREIRAAAHGAFAAAVPVSGVEELSQDLWMSLGPWRD